jgi:hypothetical protein
MGTILKTLLYLIGLVCIVATLLPLSRHEALWIRACDVPHLQIVAASVGTLVVLVVSGAIDDTAGRLLGLAFVRSDHFPILIRLDYEPRAVAVTEPLKGDADDHAEADRKLEQVGLDPAHVPGPDPQGTSPT